MEAPDPALPSPDSPALPLPLPRSAAVIPAQARSDEHLVALWLYGGSGATQRAYAADLAAFFAYAGRPLHAVTLGDMQAFQDKVAGLASATQARRLSAVKLQPFFGYKAGAPPRQRRRRHLPAQG